jgi:2-phospho-L-lactate transferase/gluconeogenesis factor (CofD/UPF0052 family)
VLQDVQRADAVVYGMGSLYTSICPTLILDGVGEAIAARTDIPKVRGMRQGEGKVYQQPHACSVCQVLAHYTHRHTKGRNNRDKTGRGKAL